MDTAPHMGTPDPPDPPHAGEPQPTVEDPSAGGYYCAANRKPQQIAQAIERGDSAWPWCMNRAGKGTTHAGVGRCRHHFGSTPSGRKSAMLRYAELHSAAVETFARAMVDPDVPWPSRIRAAENVEDRAGYPRKVEIDTDRGRDRIHEQIANWRKEHAATDDEDGDTAVDSED